MEKMMKTLKWLAIDLIMLRLLSLPFNVIVDVTEARYAEIGRKMAKSGNFITPFIRDAVPFWGKPPLSFWGTALSIDLFGVNEFGVRFASFLFIILTVFLIYYFALKVFDKLTAMMSVVILLSCSVFLYLAGAVMTDPALIFTLVLSAVAFWQALYAEKYSKLWGYVFFIGLALALLAKGLIGVVLIAFSVSLWCIVKNKWKDIWNKIPWFSGTLLMFAVALPWYLMAEIKTPGFLEYFIIGEHFERFLIPNWRGDLYGAGRGGFYGIIWLFYLVAILPWGFYFIWYLGKKIYTRKALSVKHFLENEQCYVLAFIVAPLLFFTCSGNTLLPYAALAVPFSAVLFAVIIKNSTGLKSLIVFKACAWINMFLLVLIIITGAFCPGLVVKAFKTDKWIWQTYQELAVKGDNAPLFYLEDKRFSGDFYGQGKGDKITFADFLPKLAKHGQIYLVVQDCDVEKLGKFKVSGERVYCNRDSCLIKFYQPLQDKSGKVLGAV